MNHSFISSTNGGRSQIGDNNILINELNSGDVGDLILDNSVNGESSGVIDVVVEPADVDIERIEIDEKQLKAVPLHESKITA